MSDTQQQFCLRWHNYQNSLLSSLPQLLDWDDLTDVTLYAGGCSIKAHRIVLSACSQYFKSIFKELQPMQHPVIVVPGAEFSDLSALVTFMYNGEVNIYQHQLPSLIALADTLHIKGLAQFTSGKYEDERRWGESGNETWGGTRSKRSRPSDNEETNGSIEKAIIPSPNKSMYVKKSRPRLRTASPTVSLQQQQQQQQQQQHQPPQQAPPSEILPPPQHLSQPVLEAEDLTKKERPVSPTSAVLTAPNVKVIFVIGTNDNKKIMREDNVDEWYQSSYAFDISKNLKERELIGRKIQFQSPQLKYRTKLLDWLKSVAEKLTLSNVTVHLGVFLIDKFMDNHNIMINRLASVGLVCLLIAAKFEELDCRIPKLTDLPAFVGYEMKVAEFVQLEIFILNSFNWRISWPTPAHFAEFYSLYAVNPGDRDYNFTPHRHLNDLITSSLRDFLDVTLSDVTLLEYRSSEVAAACLLAARVEHGLRPLWPKILETVTGYTIPQLQPVFNVIIELAIQDRFHNKMELDYRLICFPNNERKVPQNSILTISFCFVFYKQQI